MTTTRVTVTCAFILALAFVAATRAEDDVQRLSGKWRLRSYIIEGDDLSASLRNREMIWVFDPPMVRILRDGSEFMLLSTRFDAETEPKRFDTKYVGNNPNLKKLYPAVIKGIYEIEGDVLRRCFAIAGEPRPKKFEAGARSGNVLMVLERIEHSAPVKEPG